LALNPNGKVPTLTVDGAPLFEALAIHLWLGERWGVEQGLWPAAGTPQRLAAMSWCTWAYVTYGAVISRLHVVAHGDEQSRDTRQAERAIADLDSLLGLLDAHLTRQPWMVGDKYSLADLVVASVVGYTAFLGAPVAAHPKVQAWLSTVKARPAMQGEV
ncbi:glutathione S-transferase family protein, partial [Achromobacter sp.]|uniref:glutathione S-transferase family protein n=1 Tax=Achromobacter sp. TaxID=134375 RepID=UPI002F925355